MSAIKLQPPYIDKSEIFLPSNDQLTISSLGVLNKPVNRFILGCTTTAILLLITKPSFCYNSEGNLRNWKFLNREDPSATYLPLPFCVLLGGVSLSVFI
jgi:hypothetical protein